MTTKEKFRGMLLQAKGTKDFKKTPEARRGKEGFSPPDLTEKYGLPFESIL